MYGIRGKGKQWDKKIKEQRVGNITILNPKEGEGYQIRLNFNSHYPLVLLFLRFEFMS